MLIDFSICNYFIISCYLCFGSCLIFCIDFCEYINIFNPDLCIICTKIDINYNKCMHKSISSRHHHYLTLLYTPYSPYHTRTVTLFVPRKMYNIKRFHTYNWFESVLILRHICNASLMQTSYQYQSIINCCIILLPLNIF